MPTKKELKEWERKRVENARKLDWMFEHIRSTEQQLKTLWEIEQPRIRVGHTFIVRYQPPFFLMGEVHIPVVITSLRRTDFIKKAKDGILAITLNTLGSLAMELHKRN